MALSSGAVTVGTAATLITTCGPNPGTLHISNIDNTDTIFIGDSSVAVNAGHVLPKSATEFFTVYSGQQIFAISTKSGHAVSFFLVTP